MKTNTIFHRITVAAAGASLCLAAACSDMLDMPSKTAHESESVFKSLTLTEQAVLGIYPTFKIKAFVNYMTPDNDETMSTLTGNERAGLARYTFSAGSGQMKPVLVNRYNAINRANEVIAGIEASGKMNDANEGSDFKALYGEALACRAWAFFDILRFYGDCPMPLTPSKTGDDFNIGRVDRDIVYDQILGDLQQAADLVPWQSEVAYRDRITKAGIYGFIARIALHAAGYSLRWDLETFDPGSLRLARRNDEARIKALYEMARDACDAIMSKGENDLLSDYGEVFKHVHNKEYDVETLLQLGNYGSTANDEIGYSMGLAIGSGNPYYRQSGTLVRITPSFYCSFDEEDVRRDVTCVNYSLEKATGETVLTTIDNIGCGKWRKSWQKTQGPENAKTDINWIMIRYADILLMFAEAENELNNGPTEAAKDAFKKVRDRAFPDAVATKSTAYVDALTSKEAFFEALVKERAWELGSESNIRRTDLIRWNLLAKTIEATRKDMQKIFDDHVNPYTGEEIKVYQIYTKTLYGQNQEPYYIESIGSDTSVKNNGDNCCITYIGSSLSKAINNFASSFVEARSELMPFNQSMIDKNSALKEQQHPGYK